MKLERDESGGPPVAGPTRRGFATRHPERSLVRDLNFAPARLVGTMRAPLAG
ncbi:MAG TPA: hypothetical protein VHG30_19495 [Microvirga sp.]|nr:hypothetical protein [Microvirga sp.]